MSRTSEAVGLIKDICLNWNVGYDQANRQDIRPGGETDCSALVIFVLRSVGFQVGGATYTGNMRSELTAHGFTCLSPSVDLQPGDVLLSDAYHTAMYVGDGLIAQASIDERGEIAGGESGDQSGWETNVRTYYDYPWDCVLRPPADGVNEGERVTWTGGEDPYNPNGYGGSYVREVQELLNGHGYGLEVDGILGAKTFAAVKDYQAKNGLEIDGIPGPDTMGHLRGNRKATPSRLSEDGVWGSATTAALQRVLGTPEDGIISSQNAGNLDYYPAASTGWEWSTNPQGSQLIEALQRKVGAGADGIAGFETAKALQRYLGVPADGYVGEQTVKAMQQRLNVGGF